MKKEEEIYEARFQKHIDELKWLYMELYDDQEHFDELCASMKQFYDTRKKGLKASDLTRETDPNWYKGSDILGMMMYTKMFGGNLKGVKKHLDYLKECGINYLHLMPLMESPKDRSDGRIRSCRCHRGRHPARCDSVYETYERRYRSRRLEIC